MSDLYIEDKLSIDGDICEGHVFVSMCVPWEVNESVLINKQEAQQIVEHLTRVFDLTPT